MTEREVCEYCNNTFVNKIVLRTHINTNKKCLEQRGIQITTKYNCDGCSKCFISLKILKLHHESCVKFHVLSVETKYQQDINQRIKDAIHDQENKYHSLQLSYDKMKDIIIEQENKYHSLKLSYDNLQEEYTNHINKFESILERLASDAVNKPTVTTTNNTVNNNVRNILSPIYTLDSLEEKKLIENMRQNYTEQQFMKGLKGLAEYLYTHILKTPDNKLMICCCDTSRKKFKILDIHGNLKEDIHARYLCEKLKAPVKAISDEIHNKIRETLQHKQDTTPREYRAQHTKLDNDFFRLGEVYINVFNFDEHEQNTTFIKELCVLLNIDGVE